MNYKERMADKIWNFYNDDGWDFTDAERLAAEILNIRQDCEKCEGEGQINAIYPRYEVDEMEPCPNCDGTGKAQQADPDRERDELRVAKYLHHLLITRTPVAWCWEWDNETDGVRKLFLKKARHVLKLLKKLTKY